MGNTYSTGNPIVDESSTLNISGNIIPQSWYKTITKESGKPYLTAIVILADIVYWYKPTEVRDEATGHIIALRKKFSADLLQRNYQQISEEFGISKKEATNAVVFLEKIGVIRRELRKINMNGLILNNVLFLELIVKRLKELTYPIVSNEGPIPEKRDRGAAVSQCNDADLYQEDDSSTYEDRGIPLKRDRGTFEKGIDISRVIDIYPNNEFIPYAQKGGTNTEIITENTTIDFSHPIQSYQLIEEKFKELIGFDAIYNDRPYDQERLEEIVAIVLDVLTATAKTIRVNREDKPIDLVKSVYWKLNQFSIEYVLDSLRQSETKAHNIRSVIITALYNATMTMDNYYTNLVTHDRANSVP